MGNRKSEVQKFVSTKAHFSEAYHAKRGGKRKDKRGADKLPSQVRELNPVKELDHRTNFINTAVVSGQCSREEAAQLYDWYFNPIPGRAEQIEEIYQEARFEEMEEAHFSWVESRDNPYEENYSLSDELLNEDEMQEKIRHEREWARDSWWYEEECQKCHRPHCACECGYCMVCDTKTPHIAHDVTVTDEDGFRFEACEYCAGKWEQNGADINAHLQALAQEAYLEKLKAIMFNNPPENTDHIPF